MTDIFTQIANMAISVIGLPNFLNWMKDTSDGFLAFFINVIAYGMMTLAYPLYLIGTLLYQDLAIVWALGVNLINMFLSIPASFQSQSAWRPSNAPPIWIWLITASIMIEMAIRIEKVLEFIKKWIPLLGYILGK